MAGSVQAFVILSSWDIIMFWQKTLEPSMTLLVYMFPPHQIDIVAALRICFCNRDGKWWSEYDSTALL